MSLDEGSGNMQQICWRTLMPKCDFNKVTSDFIEIALRHGCSPVYLLHIYRAPFPKNISGGLLLNLAHDVFQRLLRNLVQLFFKTNCCWKKLWQFFFSLWNKDPIDQMIFKTKANAQRKLNCSSESFNHCTLIPAKLCSVSKIMELWHEIIVLL